MSPPSSQNQSANPFAELFDGFDGVGSIEQSGARSASRGSTNDNLEGPSRPALPGAWQTEEDLHEARDNSLHNGINVNKLSAQGSPILHAKAPLTDDYDLSTEANRPMTKLSLSTTSVRFEKPPSPESILTDKKHLVLKLAKRYERHDQSEPGIQDDETDPYLHAAEILANAKKKLSVSLFENPRRTI